MATRGKPPYPSKNSQTCLALLARCAVIPLIDYPRASRGTLWPRYRDKAECFVEEKKSCALTAR